MEAGDKERPREPEVSSLAGTLNNQQQLRDSRINQENHRIRKGGRKMS
jgi:hypothetical protein